MRALFAILLLALATLAFATVPASAETVRHCVAMDACSGVTYDADSVCAFHGAGRGTSTTACVDDGRPSVTRCEAGVGCREIL